MTDTPQSSDLSPGFFFSVEGDSESLAEKLEDQEYRNRLRAILADEARSTSEKLQSILQLGAEWFRVENGHLVRIDPAEGSHTITEVSGPHPTISRGATTDLSNTYCRKIIAQNEALAVENAPEQGLADDSAFQAFELSTYLGAKVVVGGELYGTACFVDREPRPEKGGESDAAALALLVRSIGQVLEQRRREDRPPETRGWLEAVYEESPAMIVMYDQSGTLIAPNARLQEKTGYEAETLVEMEVFELDREVSRKETQAFWDEMGHGDRRRWEGRFRRKDGTTFPVDVELRCLDREGERRFVLIGRDITARRKRERRYEAAFNRTYQLSGMMEPDGTLVKVNDRALQFGGLDREEVIGKPLWETYWAQTGQESKRKLEKAVRRAAEGHFVRYEREARGKEENRIVDFSILPVTDEEDEVSLLVVEARDITEWKEAEEELRRSEELHREVLGSITDTVLITRDDGTFSYICPDVEHIFGYDIGEVEEFGSISAFLGTDPAEDRALAEGEEISNIEQSVVDASGDRRDLLISVKRVSIRDGRRMYMCRDITGRKEAERELARRNDLFAKVQDMAGVGGWEYDIESGEHTWTEEVYRIYGVPLSFTPTVEEGIAHYHPEDRPAIREAFTRAVEEGEPYDVKLRLVTESGEQKWVRTRGDPQHEEDGEVVRVRGTIQDITDRKVQERRLAQIIGRVTNAIVEVDANWRFTLVNDHAETLYDMSEEDLLGRDFWDVFEEALGTRFEEEYRDVMRTREPTRFEAYYPGLDGWFNIQIYPNEDGGLAFYFEDVTERKRRERQIERQNDLFRRAQEIADVGAWEYDVDAGEFTLTDQGRRIHGFAPEEDLTPSQSHELFRPEDQSKADEAFRRAVQEGEPYDIEACLITEEGEKRWVRSRGEPQRGEDGEVARVRGAIQDITGRKQREQALEDKKEKIKELYGATEHLLTASTLDEVGDRIHDLLTRAFDAPIVGVSLVEDGEIVPKWVSVREDLEVPPIQPRDVQGGAAGARALRSGETVAVEDLSGLENEIDYGDTRSAVCVPVGEELVVYLGWAEAGAFEEFGLRLLDILAGHAAVVLDRLDQIEALRRSEGRFRRLFQEAPIGIARVDLNGHLTETNPAFRSLLGLGAEDLQGRHIERFTHEDDVEKTRSYFDDLVAGTRSSYTIEKRYRRPDGEMLWVRITTSLLEQDGDTRVVEMVEDINDQKQREAELREAKEEAERMNQLKNAFLANMSHEIRTPLTSIIGFAEAIGDATAEEEEGTVARFSRLIEESGTRLLNTLNGVLDLSKLEAGEMELELSPVDLAAEAKETVEQFGPEAKEAEVSLEAETEAGPTWAYADRQGLQIILQNLVSNAIKYTEPGGQIWVRVRTERDAAVLEVEDTGIGMDPETVLELFEAFKQASEGLGREYEGSGLGLAVTKEAVEQMDGAIDVETEKEVGSRFTVRLLRAGTENHD